MGDTYATNNAILYSLLIKKTVQLLALLTIRITYATKSPKIYILYIKGADMYS